MPRIKADPCAVKFISQAGEEVLHRPRSAACPIALLALLFVVSGYGQQSSLVAENPLADTSLPFGPVIRSTSQDRSAWRSKPLCPASLNRRVCWRSDRRGLPDAVITA
jgi:hypothetical protein